MDLFLDLVEVLRHETKPAVIAVCRSPGSEPTIVTLTRSLLGWAGKEFPFCRQCRSGGSVLSSEREGRLTDTVALVIREPTQTAREYQM